MEGKKKLAALPGGQSTWGLCLVLLLETAGPAEKMDQELVVSPESLAPTALGREPQHGPGRKDLFSSFLPLWTGLY